jgi:acylphosphatase
MSAKALITVLDAAPLSESRLAIPGKAYSKCQNQSGTAMDASARLSATIYRFVTEHKQARRYFISGNVQGVGFRYFTLRAAERLQVNGYARNLPDGRVEAYAIGTPDQLAKLRSILERGPWGATVSEVKEEQAAIDPNYGDGFVINY